MKKILFLFIGIIPVLLILISCAKDIEVSTEDGLLANNNIADFYFYYPPEFTLDKNAAMISIYATDDERIATDIAREDGEVNHLDVVHPNLSATVFGFPEEYETIDEYWEVECMPMYKSMFSAIEITGAEDLVIAEYNAKRYNYNATMAGMEFQYSQVIILRGVNIYTITYTSTPQKFEKYISLLDTVLDTFAFK